jgi:site-specific recombinase XerD
MGKTVAAADERRPAMNPRNQPHDCTLLYSRAGARKYLNHHERRRALMAMQALRPDKALCALVLAWTGARISEVLTLTPASFQIERSVVALRTLKRRRHIIREVPIPPELMAALDRHFHLGDAQRDHARAHRRLWLCHRATFWRSIKHAMTRAQIHGPAACPRGLRHSFGVGALQNGVPLHLLQRWLGHARISTTAIYTDVCGPEEQAFAAQFWRANDNRAPMEGGGAQDSLARPG